MFPEVVVDFNGSTELGITSHYRKKHTDGKWYVLIIMCARRVSNIEHGKHPVKPEDWLDLYKRFYESAKEVIINIEIDLSLNKDGMVIFSSNLKHSNRILKYITRYLYRS